MRETIDVNTGDVVVRQGRCLFYVSAIGSCIAAAAYDATTKTAGMAHIMLPGRAPIEAKHPTRYAANAIEQMLAWMEQSGAAVEAVEVCLVGAGNVLRNPDDLICQDNIESVTKILAEKKIPVRASHLGGFDRKSAILDTETGRFSYTRGDDPVTVLWTFCETANPDR
jgi:chemotaxis protein CheD